MSREGVPLSPEQSRLAADYVPLALTLAKPFMRYYPHLSNDLMSNAMLATVEAARTFDPSRNVKFYTHVKIRIQGSIVDTLRGSAPRGYHGTPRDIHPTIGHADRRWLVEEYGSVFMGTPDPPVGSEAEYREEVERLSRRLPRFDGEVFRLYYIDGFNRTQIADIVGKSRSRVDKSMTESHRMLREYIENNILDDEYYGRFRSDRLPAAPERADQAGGPGPSPAVAAMVRGD